MKTKSRSLFVAAIAASIGLEAYAVEWNVSLWGKRRAFTEHVEKLAELIAANTNGDFRLNLSYGGLSKNKENLDGIQIGAFEMAQFCAGYHADKNPAITVLELPFLGVTSLEQEVAVSQAVYAHPATVADMARWNAQIIMPSPMPQYNIAGVGDAPLSLDGFDGMAVRATGGIGVAMKALGAEPQSMSASEVRQALDSGVVKGVAFAPHAHMSFGTIEKATWWTSNLNPGTVNCPVVVNTDALESLSDDHRQALMDAIEPALQHYLDNYTSKTLTAWEPTLAEKGIKTIEYPADDVAELSARVAEPAALDWIEQNNAKGLPAQELYDLVKSIVTQ